jgi:hypothetical protein
VPSFENDVFARVFHSEPPLSALGSDGLREKEQFPFPPAHAATASELAHYAKINILTLGWFKFG